MKDRLLLWCRQNAKGQGSNNDLIRKYRDDYKDIPYGDENYIEFLDNTEDYELREIVNIFNLSDFKYEDNIIIGKEYQPIKDLLELYEYNIKETLPFVLLMSKTYVSNIEYKE